MMESSMRANDVRIFARSSANSAFARLCVFAMRVGVRTGGAMVDGERERVRRAAGSYAERIASEEVFAAADWATHGERWR